MGSWKMAVFVQRNFRPSGDNHKIWCVKGKFSKLNLTPHTSRHMRNTFYVKLNSFAYFMATLGGGASQNFLQKRILR